MKEVMDLKYFTKKRSEEIDLPMDNKLTSEEAQELINKNLFGYYKGRVTVNDGQEYTVKEIVELLAKLDDSIQKAVSKTYRERQQ